MHACLAFDAVRSVLCVVVCGVVCGVCVSRNYSLRLSASVYLHHPILQVYHALLQ